MGLQAYPTAANFVAVTVPGSATAAYEAMLARGIVTRSGDALGMPGRLRITIGTTQENDAVIEALASLVPAHA
jgi:histidinol-phosphate aminotransferase